MKVRCKYCRCHLLSDDELTHLKLKPANEYGKPTTNESIISHERLPIMLKDLDQGCSHFFSEEPPVWLRSVITRIDDDDDDEARMKEGKIDCPQCGKKVGNFSWIGSPCSCGEWIIPAFAFLRSRTDPSPD